MVDDGSRASDSCGSGGRPRPGARGDRRAARAGRRHPCGRSGGRRARSGSAGPGPATRRPAPGPALPSLDGLEVARRSRAASPSTAVVALTAHDEQAYVLAMLEAGATGYLSKVSRGREVVQAVRAAAAGETVFSPTIASSVKQRALGGGRQALLTRRELDVLRAA